MIAITEEDVRQILQSTLYSNFHHELRDLGSKNCYQRFARSVLCSVLLFVTCTFHAASLAAQSSPDQADTSGAREKQARELATQTKTITGCLQKGYEPDEFSITGEDGKVWGLRSSAVKLDGHLGQKVTVSGLISHQSKAGETKTEGEPGNEESGDLRVSSLTMVSETCGKEKQAKRESLTFVLDCANGDCPLLKGVPQTSGMRSGSVKLRPGESVGWHSTGEQEEALIILHGTGAANIEGLADVPVHEKMLAYIPPGTKHNVTNTGTELLEYVWVVAPTGQK